MKILKNPKKNQKKYQELKTKTLKKKSALQRLESIQNYNK